MTCRGPRCGSGAKGSAGGHHGVESVIGSIGTNEFPRVRLGIHPGGVNGRNPSICSRRCEREQLKELDELLDYAAQAVESIIAEGVEKAMTKFNRRAQGLQRGRMRIYEELFIVRPDATDEEIDPIHRTDEAGHQHRRGNRR